MDHHERMFAQRAFDMLHDSQHITQTDEILRIPNAVEFPGARWPGYLGSRFQMGEGVLAVANVHRELHSGRLKADARDDVNRTVEATRRLQQIDATEPADEALLEYLDGHRPAYRAGLSGGWRVAYAFRKALDACGVDFSSDGIDEIAYANASCCQVPEDKRFEAAGVNPKAVKTALREVCITRHPISDLVKWLEPEVVLSTSADAYEHLKDDPTLNQVVILYFHQQLGSHPLLRDVELDGRLFRAADKPHIDEWAPALGRHLANNRR